MEKYIIVSPGRAASNSIRLHIQNSLTKRGIANSVENLDTPMLWPELVEDPENWNVVISTRRDMLAQVLSFYSIILTKQTHKFKEVPLEPFVIPRVYFFVFALGILFFHDKIFGIKEWPAFKSIHWLVYEDITQDWKKTGESLGFDDWDQYPECHALGYGPVWDKVINKQEVLSWVEELQKDYQFTTDLEKYKL